MGVDFYSNALIGLKVKRDQVVKLVKAKIFAHDYPEHWEVDPVTKRNLWYEDEEEEDVSPYTLFDCGEHSGVAIIALRQAESDSHRSSSDPGFCSLDDYTEKEVGNFRRAMKERGLWSDKDFGLWAVSYVSC